MVGGALLAPAKPALAAGSLRWAYYVPDDPRSYRSLAARHAYLDIVSPDAWRLQRDGSITSRVQPNVIAQMRAWGLRVVPMIQKWSYGDKMHGFFSSPALRAKAANTLAELVINGKYDGINFDIENIEPRDGPAMEAFFAAVTARVRGAGRLVTTTLPARTQGVQADFNFVRLGRMMDLVVVMAYDYSYSGGAPAPVAPLLWVRSVAAHTVSLIPRGKVLLGVSWYGYDWNRTTRRPAPYVSFGEVAGKAGAHTYDSAVQAPSVRYTAGGQQHIAWYENARSVRAKFDVAAGQGVAGWAAWRLGYEDPAIWSLLSRRR
jgi:spore germination protein YaaH